jgi:hypothetical protein
MKRKIAIEIDCNKRMCLPCQFVNDIDNRYFCNVLNEFLETKSGVPQRCKTCLENEVTVLTPIV